MRIKWVIGDDEYSWERLSDVRRDDPIVLAVYILENNIKDRRFLLKWAKRLLYRIKSLGAKIGIEMNIRQRRVTKGNKKRAHQEMFGVKIPRTAAEALNLDE